MSETSFSFEAFASHKFYVDVIKDLVEISGLKPGQTVLDLGAGTGAVSRILAEKVAGDPEGEIIAVEPSASALEIARRNLTGLSGAVVRFVQAGAEKFSSLIRKPVDAVFFCNAIHLVDKKDQMVEQVRATLKVDGLFSFNTTFYDGGEPPESQQFYRRWMSKALRILKDRYNLRPTREKTQARDRLTPQEYQDLVQSHGFEMKINEQVTVDMPLQSFEDISDYELWITGTLPGVPLEIGAEVLKAAVRDTFDELNLTSSHRKWLLMVAAKA